MIDMHLNRPATDRVVTRHLVGVALAYLIVLLDTTVLAVAEPDLIRSLDTGPVGVGWATTGYTITFAALLVLAGATSDRIGAHRMFRSGVAAFGAVSMLCAAAPDIGALVAARVLLGCCAAAIVGSSMPVLVRLYPDAARRARAVSVWASVSGAALALGPAVGGPLVDAFGWRSVFLLNGPLAAVALTATIGAAIACPAHSRHMAVLPHLLAVSMLGAVTLAIVLAGRAGDQWWAVTVAGGAALLAAATRWADRRSVAPIVPEQIARSRPVLIAFAFGAVVNAALTTVLFVFPLQHAEDSAGRVGLLLLPLTVPLVVNPLLTGRIVARRGAFLPIRIGIGALTVGLGVLAAAADGAYGWVALGLLCCGVGVSFSLPALVAFAVRVAPPDATGSVGGLLNASRQVGATIAAAGTAATIGAGTLGAVPLAAASALALAAAILTVGRRVRSPAVTILPGG